MCVCVCVCVCVCMCLCVCGRVSHTYPVWKLQCTVAVTGFCRIFEIEGVERSLYGYLMFTSCGVIYTLW